MHVAPKKIGRALRDRAVRLAREHRSEHPSLTATSAAAARQVRVGHEAVHRRMLQADTDDGTRNELTSPRALRDQKVGDGGHAFASRRCNPSGGDKFLRGRTRLPRPLIMPFIDTMRAEEHAVESILTYTEQRPTVIDLAACEQAAKNRNTPQ